MQRSQAKDKNYYTQFTNFKFPNEAQQGTIFLNIERYKDSGLKSFVTTCKTRLECYKKIQWGIKTGRFVYCKKVTMVINNHIVWGIDFEHKNLPVLMPHWIFL
jgi:hypothetical protein